VLELRSHRERRSRLPRRSWESDDTRHECVLARITLWRPTLTRRRKLNEVGYLKRGVRRLGQASPLRSRGNDLTTHWQPNLPVSLHPRRGLRTDAANFVRSGSGFLRLHSRNCPSGWGRHSFDRIEGVRAVLQLLSILQPSIVKRRARPL
jgi:hypothetical protein